MQYVLRYISTYCMLNITNMLVYIWNYKNSS